MRISQIMYDGMINSIVSFGQRYQTIIAQFPILGTSFTLLQNKKAEIDALDLELQDLIKGKKELRDSAKKTLIEMLARLSDLCLSYAINTNNTSLREIMDTSKSKLDKIRLDYLGHRAADLIGSLRANREGLALYSVTDEMVDEAEEQLIVFNVAQASKKAAYATKSAKLAEMETLFKEARGILDNDLDNQIILIKDGNPAIYQEYLNLRKLTYYPASHEDDDESVDNGNIPEGEGGN